MIQLSARNGVQASSSKQASGIKQYYQLSDHQLFQSLIIPIINYSIINYSNPPSFNPIHSSPFLHHATMDYSICGCLNLCYSISFSFSFSSRRPVPSRRLQHLRKTNGTSCCVSIFAATSTSCPNVSIIIINYLLIINYQLSINH